MKDILQSETPAATQSKFTAANVFGIFLTLILCLLSQPLGSLLYCAGRPGPLRSLVLALWRLNPLGCVCEALIICIAFGRTIWTTCQNRQASFSEWRTRFRRTAAALLVLRAQTWTKDGFLVVPRLFWVAGVEGYPPDPTMGYRQLFTLLESELQATTQYTSTRTPALPGRPGLWPETARARMEKSFNLSRGTDMLPPPDNLSDGFPDLGQLLGSHASRSEVFIQAVASVGVLAVVVKIAASKLTWSVKLPAYFMLAGWCAVQTLLLLLYGGEPSETEMQKTAHLARDIDRDILSGTYIAGEWRASWTRMGIIWLIPLPVAVYLAASITKLISSQDGPTFLRVLVTVFEIGLIPPTILVLFTNIVSLILFLGLVTITGLVLLLFSGSKPETELAVVLYTMIRGYLLFLHLFPLLTLPASMTPPGMVWGNKTGKVEAVGVLLHVAMCAVLFLALLHFYDSSETLKPEWLEWLG